MAAPRSGPPAALVLALLLALGPVAFAGCGEPAAQPPTETAAPVRELRLEAEAFREAEPACGGGDGLVGLLYATWASEGLVARLPSPGCALRMETDLPDAALLRAVRVLAEPAAAGAEARVEVFLDGKPAGAAAWSPVPEAAHDLVFEGAAPAAGGPHDLRLLFDVADGPRDWALQVDYLLFEAPLPQPNRNATAAAPTANGTASTGVGLAGPLRVEAETFDYAVPGCATAQDQAESRAAAWASNGWAVLLPRHGCGLVFEDFDLLGSGRFTRFAGQFGTSDDVEVRLRVVVDGATVAQRTFDQREDQVPFEGEFEGLVPVAAGRHDLRLEYEVLSGPREADLVVDYVEFLAGD